MSVRNSLQRMLDKVVFWYYKKRVVLGNRPYYWCEVSVPATCPMQSQTHPSILFIKDAWQGITHWLATTPYPNAQVEFENPCLYYANKGNEFPTQFTPIASNPILAWPGGSCFNSDVALFIDNNKLYSLIREYDNDTLYKEIKVQSSVDGQTWSSPLFLYRTEDSKQELLSPSILSYQDKVRIYCLNGDAGVRKKGICTGIDILEGVSLDNSNFTMQQSGVFLNSHETGIQPWHCDLFIYKEKLYMVLCGRNIKEKSLRAPMNTYLAVSENYQDFYIYDTPLIQHIKTYRPSAYINEKKLVLYFSAVGYYLADGSDRSIGVTSFDMERLLKELSS